MGLITIAQAGLLHPNGECTKFGAAFGQCRKKCASYEKAGIFRDYCLTNATTHKTYCYCWGWPPDGGDFVCRPGRKRCGAGFTRKCSRKCEE